MVWIVEMGWGRPHQRMVYKLDEDGDLAPDYVIPSDQPPDPEYRYFSCHGSIWPRVLELGREHGWRPLGTTPSEQSKNAWEKLGRFEDDYRPEEWQYAKQFQADDVAALAAALQRAIDEDWLTPLRMQLPASVLLRGGMTNDEYKAANRGLTPEFLQDFIAFLRKGQFVFAWDD